MSEGYRSSQWPKLEQFEQENKYISTALLTSKYKINIYIVLKKLFCPCWKIIQISKFVLDVVTNDANIQAKRIWKSMLCMKQIGIQSGLREPGKLIGSELLLCLGDSLRWGFCPVTEAYKVWTSHLSQNSSGISYQLPQMWSIRRKGVVWL